MLCRYLVLILIVFNLISCGNQPSTNPDSDKTPTPGENLPPPDSKTVQEALQGTWCYYSATNGFPLYLGIKVEGEKFQVASIYEAYVSPEGVIEHPVTDPLTFREVAGVIDESDGLASIPLPSDLGGNLTIFNNSVPLLFNGITKNYIKVKYGLGKIGFFKKMDSSQGENCPELKISPEELERFPQVDDDGDGFMDYRDNCVAVANPDQKDGNGDGIGDVCMMPIDCDPLPSCFFGEDQDGDGVEDFQDNCPEVANPDQKDSDGNSAGDVCQSCPEGEVLVNGICQELEDQDGDGTPDTKDKCPFETNINFPAIGQSDLDSDGIGDKCDDDVDGDGKLNEQDDLNCIVKEGKADCTFSSLSDGDKDGIDDLHDNCLGTFNPNQEDSNNNGIGDACVIDKNNNGTEDVLEIGAINNKPQAEPIDCNGNQMSVPSGFSLVGSIAEKSFSVIPEGIQSFLVIIDSNRNAAIDSGEPLVLGISNELVYKSGGNIFIQLNLTIDDALAPLSNGPYCGSPSSGHFGIYNFKTDYLSGGPNSGKLSFDSVQFYFNDYQPKDKIIVSGFYRIMLQDNQGEIKGTFKTAIQLIFPEEISKVKFE